MCNTVYTMDTNTKSVTYLTIFASVYHHINQLMDLTQ